MIFVLTPRPCCGCSDLLIRVALEDGQVLWVSDAAHEKLHAEGKLGSPPPVAEAAAPPSAAGEERNYAPPPQQENTPDLATVAGESARRDQAIRPATSRLPGKPLAQLLAEARQAKKDSEAAPDDAALAAAFLEKRRLFKQAKERSQDRSTTPSSGASAATSGEADQLQQQIARMQRDNRQAQQKMEQRMEKLQATVDLQSTHTSATCALM